MSTSRPAAYGTPREGVDMTPCRYCVLENIIEGDEPQEHEHIFHASEDGAFVVGLWSCTPCTERVTSYPTDEFCVVLEGQVVLTSDDGTVAEYREGDAFVWRPR